MPQAAAGGDDGKRATSVSGPADGMSKLALNVPSALSVSTATEFGSVLRDKAIDKFWALVDVHAPKSANPKAARAPLDLVLVRRASCV
jgi:hypothetical protein